MFRFLLLVLVVGSIALYFTNPSTDDVRTKLNGHLPAQMSGAPSGTPADQSSMPPSVPSAVLGKLQGEMQFERKDYYLFSVYKVSIGGNQMPGCIIGIAKQAVPYDKC
jgi:hypothetical protein